MTPAEFMPWFVCGILGALFDASYYATAAFGERQIIRRFLGASLMLAGVVFIVLS